MQKPVLPDSPDYYNGRASDGGIHVDTSNSRYSGERNIAADLEPRSIVVEWLRIIRRHRGLVAAFTFAGVTVAAIVSMLAVPKYRSTNFVELQAINQDFLNLKALLPSTMAGSLSTETNVQTQVHIISSPVNLLRTMVRLRVEQQGRVSRPHNLLVKWLESVGWYQPEPVPTKDLIGSAVDSVKVKSVGPTRLIQIQADSTDPVLAAQVANDTADEYIKTVSQSRIRLNQETSKWLKEQLADLRNTLQQSEERLQHYATSSRLLYLGNSANTTSVAEDKLKEMQNEVSKAQGDRMAKQSAYEQSIASRPDALPPVLDNGPLRDYQLKLADLNRQMAELSADLTSENPKVVRIKDQIASLEQTSQRERDNIVSRISNEFETAKRREELLLKNYKDQEAIVASQEASVTHYNLLKSEVETNRAVYEATMQKAKDANIAAAFQTNAVSIVSPGFIPERPFAPSLIMNLAVGLLVGLASGLAMAFMRNQADRLIRAPGEVGLHLGLQELGAIPTATRALAFVRRNHEVEASGGSNGVPKKLSGREKEEIPFLSESFRATLLSILFTFRAGHQGNSRTIVVTSAEAGDGKTTTVANLGSAIMEMKRRVLLVDADLRRPRLHENFRVPNERGMCDILSADVPIDEQYVAKFITSSGKPGLDLLLSGSSCNSISALFGSHRLEKLVRVLRSTYDIVVFDTPPMGQSADARVLGRHVDGVILVIRAGRTTVDAAVSARTRLQEDGSTVMGTILNQWNPREIGNYYKQYGRY